MLNYSFVPDQDVHGRDEHGHDAVGGSASVGHPVAASLYSIDATW
jgi:hypothetical protein